MRSRRLYKEKLKEGLRASHLRMLPLLSLLTPPTCAAPLIQRSGRRVVLPRRGEVIIWLFIDDVAGGGGVGRCGGGYFILLCLFVSRAIIFPIFLFLLCARSWCFSLSSLSKKIFHSHPHQNFLTADCTGPVSLACF